MDFSSIIDIQGVINGAVAYIPKVLAAIFIFWVFKMAFKLSKTPIKHMCEKIKLEKPIIHLLVDEIYKYALLVFGAIMAASQLGIDVGAILAGLGVAGLALGFAAQDTLSNIIAGFIIFLDKPFKVGDWVEVESKFGKVWEITMRSTRIRTLNNTYVVIPNKNIIDAVLDNHSKYGETRIEVPVGIAYKEDIPKAREVILGAIKDIKILSEKPEPDVVVQELGDSSVNLQVRVWVDKAEKESAAFAETLEVSKIALDTAKIQIPFPHMQLFVDDIEKNVVEKMKEVATMKK